MDHSGSTPKIGLVGLGFLAAVAVVAVFVWVVGVGAVGTALQSAKLWVLPLLLGVSVLGQLLWSLCFGIVLSVLGIACTRTVLVVTYLGVVFANNVTPFAQAGAEPFAALVVSRSTDTRFEVSLSAVATNDALNVFPSVGLVTVSLVYFVVKTSLDPRIEVASLVFVGVAVLTTGLGLLAWRKRTTLGRWSRRFRSWSEPALGRLGIRPTPFGRLGIGDRTAEFAASLERLRDRPDVLVIALVYSTGGWACLVAVLWGSLYAIGYTVPLEVAMLVVPLGMVASLTPLPGGAGGIEAAFIFLLGLLTPVPIAAITGAVLVFRAATFICPVIAGGAAIAVLSARKPLP